MCLLIKSEVKEPVTCLDVFLTDRMMASLVRLTLHWQQCNWGNYSPLSPACPHSVQWPLSINVLWNINSSQLHTWGDRGLKFKLPLLPWSSFTTWLIKGKCLPSPISVQYQIPPLLSLYLCICESLAVDCRRGMPNEIGGWEEGTIKVLWGTLSGTF